VVFSFNILNGGAQDKDAVYDCVGPQMGGLGQYSPNCNMTAQQIRDWGKALAPSSCALMTWTFDAAYLTKPGNQAAMSDVALFASGLSRRPCTTSRAPNTPPVAAFSSTCINLSCGFTDASTDDGTIVSWSWDFGDQQTSTAQSPTHTYAAGGPYDVKLTVTDDKGSSNSVTHTVTVSPANSPPVAAFSSTCPDLSCGFTDASTDDGSIASWSWDFGDQQTSTAQSPNHTYGAGGSYDVKLTVTDDKGSSNSVTHTVTVAPNAAPNVEFSATCTDLDCSFTDQSTDDGSVLSWSWDFGDGSSSTDTNPIHPYASANDYQVKLTVTDDKGKQASVTHTVTPTAPATTGAAP
jgi:PKD repeat protein